MQPYVFRLPDIGEGVAEAEIVAWHVKVGDRIEEDQPLVDVMTDKATVDIAAPVAGRVAAIHGEVGQRLAVGSPLIEFDVDQSEVTPPASQPKSPTRDSPETTRTPQSGNEPPLTSPAIRRRAREHGVALERVPGTGPHGRITMPDFEAYVALGSNGKAEAKRTGIVETQIVGLRRKIAERMEAANRRIPHFSYVEEFDLTELEGLRKDLNAERKESEPKLTLLPFLMQGLVRLLPDFPQFNAHYDDEARVLRSHAAIHIGIATQTPAGLMVPVVRHAEALDLWGCARELVRVTAAARDGSATREELTGSTITLTSLGALGGIAATPIINHPEVAILGPNKLIDLPRVFNGLVTIRTMMNLSASFDHRIIDGYDAARFVQALKRLLERPALLFLNRK